jgi:hypothetical protein
MRITRLAAAMGSTSLWEMVRVSKFIAGLMGFVEEVVELLVGGLEREGILHYSERNELPTILTFSESKLYHDTLRPVADKISSNKVHLPF